MIDTPTASGSLQARLQPVIDLLEKHRLVDAILRQQQSPRQELVEAVTHRQQQTELTQKLRALHVADVAHLLQMLTPEDRLLVWGRVPATIGGDILWELSDATADALVAETPRERLVAMCRAMEPDDLSQIAPHIPEDVLREVYQGLSAGERSWVQTTIAYPEDSVGHLMSSDIIVIGENATVRTALQELRGRGALPEQTDKLFVVDERHRLRGALPLTALLLSPPQQAVDALMEREVACFSATDPAASAAHAFERYDLVSAPVVDGKGKLVGRITVDRALDYVREKAEANALRLAGLPADPDLFAPIWASARQRWL